MWVVGDTLMLWPMIPVAIRWMHMEERKAVRIDHELEMQAAGAAPSVVAVPPPAGGGTERAAPCGAGPVARAPGWSAPQVHQFDPHAVGIRAVDELERRAAQVDARAAGSSTTVPPSADQPGRHDPTSRTRNDRCVRPSRCTGRRRGPRSRRFTEGQQLDGRGVPV